MRSDMPGRGPNAGTGVDETVDPSRRRLFMLMAAAPVALLGFGPAASAQEQTCFDPAKLPAGQVGMRKSLGFKPVSPTPDKVCAGCAFFTPAGSCGKCALLSGGVVAANSVCDSWAKKS